MQSLTLTRPDDAHLHLRDGADLASVLPHTARVFARAVVMPNLRPPITDTALAAEYRGRVLKALPKGSDFEPLMTLYLTDSTSAETKKYTSDDEDSMETARSSPRTMSSYSCI